jgi:hypothetical protein
MGVRALRQRSPGVLSSESCFRLRRTTQMFIMESPFGAAFKNAASSPPGENGYSGSFSFNFSFPPQFSNGSNGRRNDTGDLQNAKIKQRLMTY